MKTITISDEVYEKLVRIKGKKSFSAVIDELIKRNVEKRVEMLIKSAERSGYEDELERISKEIRRNFSVRF
jgi:predicted CopG family antitoxin